MLGQFNIEVHERTIKVGDRYFMSLQAALRFFSKEVERLRLNLPEKPRPMCPTCNRRIYGNACWRCNPESVKWVEPIG